MPAWERLLEFHGFATGLPEAAACATSIDAMVQGRSLLADPDAAPELIKQLATTLRKALGKLQGDLATAFQSGTGKLAASQVWSQLKDDQRNTLSLTHQLAPPANDAIGTDDEILGALRASTLSDRANLIDAVPQRFSRALDEASRLLEPKAQRVTLDSATIRNTAELDKWLEGARMRIEDNLKDGPVIL